MKVLFLIVTAFLLGTACGSVEKAPEHAQQQGQGLDTAQSQSSVPAANPHLFSLSLDTTDGDTFSARDVRGKKVLYVSFWATWCEPCKEELKQLALIYPKYKEQLQIVAVALDPEDSMNAVQEFAVETALPFPVLVDPSGNVTHDMVPGGDTVPYGILVSKEGRVVATHTGYEPGDEKRLEREIRKLLGM